jgi:REP-associated tyrosine transposase
VPRRLRFSSGGVAYHVLNRAVGRAKLFHDEADYAAMERVIDRTFGLLPMRIISYCLMPTHWHMVLWPKEDGQLSEFLRLLTVTHTQRWHAHHHSAGTGPLYQGRFKSFPVEQDGHFLTVCRYVERNARRANLVKSARQWPWCGLAKRGSKSPPRWLLPLNRWPVDASADWPAWVNRPETAAETEAIRTCVKRGRPYGDDRWVQRTAEKLDLQSTLRPRGRQRIHPIKDSRPL